MKKLFFTQKGITLIEIILIIAILGIISTAIYSAYFQGVKVLNFNNERIEVQRAQDLVYSRLAHSIRPLQISDLTIINNNELVINSNTSYYLNGNNLVIDNGSNIRKISDLEFQEIIFTINDNKLYLDAKIFNPSKTAVFTFTNVFYPRVQ